MSDFLYFHRKKPLVVSLVMVLLLGSCAAGQNDPSADPSIGGKPKLTVAPNQPTELPVTEADRPAPIKEALKMSKQQQALHARRDLAKRLQLEIDAVKLSGVTPVMWRSGALGCPKPDTEYTQVLVPGVLIMLRVANTAYRYHGASVGEPFYCSDDRAKAPYINSSDI